MSVCVCFCFDNTKLVLPFYFSILFISALWFEQPDRLYLFLLISFCMSLGFFVCLFPSHMRCWVDVHQLSILIKLIAALHVPFLFFFFAHAFSIIATFFFFLLNLFYTLWPSILFWRTSAILFSFFYYCLFLSCSKLQVFGFLCMSLLYHWGGKKKEKKLAIEIQCAPFFCFISPIAFFFFGVSAFSLRSIVFFFRRCCSSQ